jgi:type II secretory pathway pseudopilin PulG
MREGSVSPLVELIEGLVVVGVASFSLAGGLSYALGASPRRMVAVAAVGLAGAIGVFLWGYMESSSTEDCWECGQILGRWMSPIFVFFFLPLNFLGWLTGTLVGWAIRRARS